MIASWICGVLITLHKVFVLNLPGLTQIYTSKAGDDPLSSTPKAGDDPLSSTPKAGDDPLSSTPVGDPLPGW